MDEDATANSPLSSVWVVGDGPAVSQYLENENCKWNGNWIPLVCKSNSFGMKWQHRRVNLQ